MAKTITLAQLIERVRFQGDLENSRVASDARITEIVNRGIEGVWDLLLDTRPEQYITTTTLTTTPGSDSVALPADFYRLRLVEIFLVTLEPRHGSLHDPFDLGRLLRRQPELLAVLLRRPPVGRRTRRRLGCPRFGLL